MIINLAMANAMSEKVYDELLAYISEPMFLIPVNSYMDEHCLIFDIDSPTINEHKEIHKSYKDLIGAMLVNFGDEYGKSEEEVMNIIKKLDTISDIHIMFETSIRFVYASEDFELFCTLMARRNITIQEQVLALILSIKGVLPESLRSGPTVVGNERGMMIAGDEKDVTNLVAEDILNDSKASGDIKSAVMSNIDIKDLEENQKILNEKMKKLILKEKQLHGDFNKNDEGIEISGSHEAETPNVVEDKLDPEEMKQRQDFLRIQRDKLLKMRKLARERNMNTTGDESSATKGSEQKSAPDDSKVDKNLALRRTIAEKLRQEVIGKK